MKRADKYRETYLHQWFSINGYFFFGVLTLLYLSVQLVSRILIIEDIAAFEVLQARGEMWVFDTFFALQYASIPLFLSWKFVWTTLTLWVGCFMFGYRITYAQLWKVVMIAELVFFFPALLKVLWFLLFATDPTYQEVVAFYPLSISNLISTDNLAYSYPLKALNLFEATYWMVLSLSIYWVGGKKLKTSAQIVGTSYGLLFLVWLVFYMLAYR